MTWWDLKYRLWCCRGAGGSSRRGGNVLFDPDLQSSLSRALSSLLEKPASPGDELTVNLGNDRSSGSFRRLQPIGSLDQRALGWTESRVALEIALEDNKDVRADDMLAEDERLRQRLHAFGLRLDRQMGDGNCQYRSVSQQLYGTPERHLKVRQRACDYIASTEGRRRFEPYLGRDGIDEYLASMRLSGTWGDELTLRAIAEAVHVMVSVVCSPRESWFVRYIPDKVSNNKNAEVFLAYTSPWWVLNSDRRARPDSHARSLTRASLVRSFARSFARSPVTMTASIACLKGKTTSATKQPNATTISNSDNSDHCVIGYVPTWSNFARSLGGGRADLGTSRPFFANHSGFVRARKASLL